MRKSFHLLIALGSALAVAILLIPMLGGAGPEFPNEALKRVIPANDPFPHQSELAGRVNFWRHVFGVWGRNQVALHDMTNPGIVYDVITLPESNRGIDRKGLINDRVEEITQRLYILEQKVARGDDLDHDEQELLDKFRNWGKISQLAGAHTRIRTQRGIREKFLRGLELSGRYDPLFRQIFRAHGVPEDLAFLPHVESSFQAHARSGAGAVGIWQFTLPAARLFMKVNAAVDERYDPVLAAEGCARYLSSAYAKLGDWGLAITSYNHGIGGMSRASSEFGTNFPRILEEYDGPLFGFDSRNFYVEFLAAREVARNAERYFGKVRRERPQNWEKIELDRSTPIHAVARNYGVTLTELAEINSALTNNAIRGRVSLPEGTSVWLPAGTQQRLAARPVEEDISLEPIQVVRAPEPKPAEAERVIAMVESPELQSTLDVVPLIERNPKPPIPRIKWERRKLDSDDEQSPPANLESAVDDAPINKTFRGKRKVKPETKIDTQSLRPKEKIVKAKEDLKETPIAKKGVEAKEKNPKLVVAQGVVKTNTAKTNKDSGLKNKESATKVAKVITPEPLAKNNAPKSVAKTETKVVSTPTKIATSVQSPKEKGGKGEKAKNVAKVIATPPVVVAKVASKAVAPAKLVATKGKGVTEIKSSAKPSIAVKPTVAKPEPVKALPTGKDGKGKLANVIKSNNQRRG